MKVMIIVLMAGFLTACATPLPPFTGTKGLALNPYRVHIKWKNGVDECKVDTVTESGEICVGAPGPFCVGRADLIIWTSENPSDARYEIFFDPIFGARLRSNRNGLIVRPIDKKAPFANYKYSIVRKGCAPDLVNTYDPHIRIDH